MPHADFVHLRVHTAYSLAEGAIPISRLIAFAETNEMPAIALTDTSNMFGALEFSVAAINAGIQPIIGCQLLFEYKYQGSANNHSIDDKITIGEKINLTELDVHDLEKPKELNKVPLGLEEIEVLT